MEITFLGGAAEYRAAGIATLHPSLGGCLSTRPDDAIEGSLMEDLSGVPALFRPAYDREWMSDKEPTAELDSRFSSDDATPISWVEGRESLEATTQPRARTD